MQRTIYEKLRFYFRHVNVRVWNTSAYKSWAYEMGNMATKFTHWHYWRLYRNNYTCGRNGCSMNHSNLRYMAIWRIRAEGVFSNCIFMLRANAIISHTTYGTSNVFSLKLNSMWTLEMHNNAAMTLASPRLCWPKKMGVQAKLKHRLTANEIIATGLWRETHALHPIAAFNAVQIMGNV